jgi:hypothetical protein
MNEFLRSLSTGLPVLEPKPLPTDDRFNNTPNFRGMIPTMKEPPRREPTDRAIANSPTYACPDLDQDGLIDLKVENPYIYLIGSLRIPLVRITGQLLRDYGFNVFDDWHGAGPQADVEWQKYEQTRGSSFKEALARPLAVHHFNLDLEHLRRADMAVLILPCGKSGHLEAGGFGTKRGFREPLICYFLDGEPDTWDLMYRFADDIVYTPAELTAAVERLNPLKG